MRQRIRIYAAPIACILVALCSSASRAQQDQIPKELALALIPFGGSDGGEIIVGQLPPDLATTFTLPPGGRVLGSFVSLSHIQMVMTFPGTPDSAQAFASRSLTEHGWVAQDRSLSRLGGLQYGPRVAVPTTLCKAAAAGTSEGITISTQFHGAGVTLLRLTRTTGSSPCNQSSPNFVVTSSSVGITASSQTMDMTQRMAELPLASIPPLWSPGDVRVSSQRCQQSNRTMGSQSQSQPLLTDMSMADILAHYGRQLDSAGWKTASDAESVSRTWSKAIPGRGMQEVTIRVSRMPSQSGCYDVSLQASALPR